MEQIKQKKTFFQKMAEILFVIYLSTIYFFNTQSETVYISHIAFILFAGFSGIYFLQRKRIFLGKNIMTAYIAIAWMFATYFWAYNEYVAWANIKTMWQIFILFFIVYNLFYEREDAHEFCIKSFYSAGLALIGYSFYSYDFFQIINMMSSGNSVRIGSDIVQTNVFGMQHAMTAIIAVYYLIYKKKYKVVHIAILAISFLFAMSSASRKALLMICAGALYLIYKKFGVRQMYKIIVIVTVFALVFTAVIQLPIFETIRMRMEGIMETLQGNGGDDSAIIRMNMITDGWKIFKERLLTGYGAANYSVVSRFGTYSHNNFIEVLVDFGLIGFILYYFIYWNAFRNLLRMKFDAGKALFCIFVTRFFMETAMVVYYDKTNWLLLAFFLISGMNNKY